MINSKRREKGNSGRKDEKKDSERIIWETFGGKKASEDCRKCRKTLTR